MVSRPERLTDVDSSAAPWGSDADARTLLAQLGAAMVATGQPVNEIEQELREVGVRLGYADVQVGAAPTSLTISLCSGDPAAYESVTAPVRLDQTNEVRRIRGQLVSAVLSPTEASAQLAALRTKSPLYPTWVTHIAWVLVAAGIGLILQPAWANVVVVVVCSVVVRLLMGIAGRVEVVATLLATLAAFIVTVIVFMAAEVGLIEGPMRTVLPPIAALLPGALIVTGMSELAAGHMQAGSSRLTYGVVQLGLFALGLIAATTLLSVPTDMMMNVRVDTIGWWAAPLGLLLIGVGISGMEHVEWRMLGWVLVVLLMAFGAQSSGHEAGSPVLGGFLGAVAASLGATLVELARPQLARLVLFLPAFWLLVPGSLGLIGVTTLISDQGAIIETGLDVAGVIVAIALGLLVGSSIGLAIRNTVRPTPLGS